MLEIAFWDEPALIWGHMQYMLLIDIAIFISDCEFF